MKGLLISLVLPALIGAFAFTATQWAKAVWARLDAQPAATKQAFVAAWAFVLNLATEAAGQSLCASGASYCELPDLAFRTVFSIAVAFALHGNKRKAG